MTRCGATVRVVAPSTPSGCADRFARRGRGGHPGALRRVAAPRCLANSPVRLLPFGPQALGGARSPAGQHGRNRVGRGVPDILLPVELPNGKKASVSLSTSSHSRTGVLRGARARRLGAHRSVQALPELHEGHRPVRQGQGYAVVMVHTREFGRSTGCPDFGEPGEQADVKAAINWSAKQSWSHRRSGHERQVVRRVQTSSYLRQALDGDKRGRARPTRRSGTRSARRSTRGTGRISPMH